MNLSDIASLVVMTVVSVLAFLIGARCSSGMRAAWTKRDYDAGFAAGKSQGGASEYNQGYEVGQTHAIEDLVSGARGVHPDMAARLIARIETEIGILHLPGLDAHSAVSTIFGDKPIRP